MVSSLCGIDEQL